MASVKFSIEFSGMNNQFFANNRNEKRRYGYGSQKFPMRPQNPAMNFTDNFLSSSTLHNSTMNNSRGGPSTNRNVSNAPPASNSSGFSHGVPAASEKPSFSSLFSDAVANNNMTPLFDPFPTEALPMDDDDGVYLQISNLDQWYDEANLRNYLMNQLKPITPILSLIIETPSIAKIKVPSTQFAKQVVSHLHRKKMGHKRIFVSFMKDRTSAECSALRNKVAGLLKDVPSHQLPMSKFRELFQSRFKSSISILDLYRMPEVCMIHVNSSDEKTIELMPLVALERELEKTDQHSAPYCTHHFKADKNKGWAEIEIDALPNVMMSVSQVQAMIHPLLRMHQGDLPIASLIYCLEAVLQVTITANDQGVPLEHLVSCVPGVVIKNNDFGIKILAWKADGGPQDDSGCSSSGSLNLSCGDAADTITKEVIELIRMCPKSTMVFSKFIPTYHNHFGKQCRVADYGCTKLIEMFEAMSSIVQILGDGESRHITLTHSTQLRRFSADLFKILRAQPNKSLHLSLLPQAYLTTHNRIFNVTDYGVCDLEDLLEVLRNNNFIMATRKRDENDDICLYLQKRRQSNAEQEKTSIFAGEVVELLRNSPQYTIAFRKLVRSYHYHFGYQCKLSDYGFMRLAELLESLTGTVEMDKSNEDSRKIFLSRRIALRIFSEQIHELIKEMTGMTALMVKVDDVLELHKNKYGYTMQGSSLGYETVIDAMKFVPFIELSSYDNELWIISHLDNEKFRQRAMLACLAIIDIGIKVPLNKFHAVFGDKFKFNISEKTLHAMKHAVEIDMVNGVKMISVSHMMKFFVHLLNILEHRSKISIQEIKSIMKLSVSTTFNFGYPNVSSLLQAFPDIFKVEASAVGEVGAVGEKSCGERIEIEVKPECPLHPSGLRKLLGQKLVQMPEEQPEMYYKPKITPIGLPLNMRCISKPTPSHDLHEMEFQREFQQSKAFTDDFFQRNLQQYGNQYHRNNPFAPGYGDATMSTTMPTEVMSQMNTPYHQQQMSQQGFPYQRSCFDEGQSAKSMYERNLQFQQMQQYQAMKRDFLLNSGGGMFTGSSSGISSAASSLAGFEARMQQQYPASTSFFNRFDPPKPDTPPSKPLWLDPVWKCDGNFLNNRNSGPNFNQDRNGNSDLLKAFNFHVVSPYMSFKTMFTFDNANPNGSGNQ